MINHYVFPSKIIIHIDVMIFLYSHVYTMSLKGSTILVVLLIYVKNIGRSLMSPKTNDFPVLSFTKNDKFWRV
jgi:hypothetical protein